MNLLLKIVNLNLQIVINDTEETGRVTSDRNEVEESKEVSGHLNALMGTDDTEKLLYQTEQFVTSSTNFSFPGEEKGKLIKEEEQDDLLTSTYLNENQDAKKPNLKKLNEFIQKVDSARIS